jgi:hypothetical protein
LEALLLSPIKSSTGQDDSSGTLVNEELGHSYQQLIRCFDAFFLMKNDEGNPIHGD